MISSLIVASDSLKSIRLINLFFLANTELVTPNSKSTEQNSKRDSNGRRQRTYSRDADVSECDQNYVIKRSTLRLLRNRFVILRT